NEPHPRPDGTIVPVTTVKFPNYDDDGRVTGVVCFFWTHRPEPEQMLLIVGIAGEIVDASENNFMSSFGIAFSNDMSGKLTKLNKAGENALGYAEDEWRALTMKHIVAPEHVSTAFEMIDKLRTDDPGGTRMYELDLIAKNGDRISTEIASRLID